MEFDRGTLLVRGSRYWNIALVTLVAAGFALAGAGSASALTPPPIQRAEVVYSNGGRILSMKADGSKRKVLASRFSKVENTDLGYTEPAVSPDGDRIAFVNRRSRFGYDRYVNDIRVMNADGSGAVKVLSGDANNSYTSPSWSPDGERLIAAYYWIRGKKQTGGIVSIRPDGSDRQIIFRLKTLTVRHSWLSAPAVESPVISPDGTKVLFLRLSRFNDEDGQLRILDLATGHTVLVSKGSHGGSWSPDGSKVVHSSWATGGLTVSRADGSEPRLLAKLSDEETRPEWSPDGFRIVFASDRNLPESEAAYEIYSVRTDGSCLTWLTNGSPASTAPTWSRGGAKYSDPGSCGARDRKVLQEVTVPNKVNGRHIKLWMGLNFRGRLFTGAPPLSVGESYPSLGYSDCAFFDPARCGSGLETMELSMCRARNLGDLADGSFGKARGVPFWKSSGDASTIVAVISGYRFFYVFRDSSDRLSNRQVLAGMRPFGPGPFKKKLPPPRWSAQGIRLMKKVERVHRRTGSVARTAKVVGIGRKSVRQNLRLRPLLRRFGPIRTVKCKPRRRTGVAPSFDRRMP